MVWEQMLYKEIQDSGHGCNLGYKTESFLQLKPSIMPECIKQSFSISSEDNVWEELALRGFQNSCHCGHLGYCNVMQQLRQINRKTSTQLVNQPRMNVRQSTVYEKAPFY